ncbi:uncharacterized membrane protein YcaP (DUF421 family) [Bacillus pakistanensis]|uniref:Uncharacterized membrane protein YcaP (DUF421 family) n=1 Tax=Rossellomorea pakistanensis TaxID=992288 RepID=A0ABS2NFF7_9BACI|nr:DUF421 domain-containing protein [Bacillus pakistanensis]MBM7586555.1 uncharacterized membrane protein YcaP (DUF421 family) [Bacillus pakistanensis]
MPEYFEVAFRSIGIVAALFFITKLLGKKQLSKLSFFEYITGVTVGSIAGTLSMDLDLALGEGLMSILIWFSIPFIFSLISLKSTKFRHFVEGIPTVFIENGNIDEKALKREKYTTDELLEQLRKKNIFRVADVEFASLDTNGDLSVLLKKNKQPLIFEDINIAMKKATTPQMVISDGVVDKAALKKVGFNEAWLQSELKKRNIGITDIFLAQLDEDGHLTLDLFHWQKN